MKVELKNKIVFGLWLLFGTTVFVLLIAAAQKRMSNLCGGLKIEINTDHQSYFVTEKEVNEIVNASGNITEREVKSVDIAALELAIQKNAWVKNAEIYFENNNTLHIDIQQRQPIARLFTVNGNSTYIDKEAMRLPIKTNACSRVLAITGFPSDNNILAHTDSMLLMQVKEVANFVSTDTFWNAQIAQVDINTSGKFELVPTVGNHIVLLGDTNDLKEKFKRLYTFYTKAWLQNGMNTYSIIDVRFNNQVVATRKGSFIEKSDSIINTLQPLDSLMHTSNDSLQRGL